MDFITSQLCDVNMSFSLLLPPEPAVSFIVLLLANNIRLRAESLASRYFANASGWGGNIAHLEVDWWLPSQSLSLRLRLFSQVFGPPFGCLRFAACKYLSEKPALGYQRPCGI